MSSAHTAGLKEIHTRCCISGGGPAGMMLGFLLARAGVEVVVLEKHADFLRDFRGDTFHPSTLQVMHELGLLEEFLKLPHNEARQLYGQIGSKEFTVADFSHLPTRCKFIAFMPQWDFLDFLAAHTKRYPAFHLEMEAEITDLIQSEDRVVGVRAKTRDGMLEVHADLTVGTDGRHSTVREKAGLEVINLGAPTDVLWMRISRQPSDPGQTLGRFDDGRIMIMLDRGDYWQGAFIIRKGSFGEIQQRGLEAFRDGIAMLAPFLRDRISEITDWSKISLLSVAVDRLQKWYRLGLLCIGDAAHAMSPIGGVGINLAIQDAVAAANILAAPLLQDSITADHLAAIQRRRMFPTRMTQGMQVFMQNHFISNVLQSSGRVSPPTVLKMMRRWPLLQRIPARVIGIGFRPEHVQTPEAPITHSR
jgi:2-polyprenyl-6-methoxyphenol hydroxylase-like FAD-dependent oxidoreductase